jgi:transposase, IS30 family
MQPIDDSNTRRLTADAHRQVFDMLAEGYTHPEVAYVLGCSTKAVQRLLNSTGGLPPRPRFRSPRCLSLAEREEISRGMRSGPSCRYISRQLGRAASTVSCEVAANGRRQRYRAWREDNRALRQSRRPKAPKLVRHQQLRFLAERLLKRRSPPEQIAHRLRLGHPTAPRCMYPTKLSTNHCSCRPWSFAQGTGGVPTHWQGRRRGNGRAKRPGEGQLKDMVLLSERPADAKDRAIPRQWEGDLIIGKSGRSAMATLVERQSRFVILIQLGRSRTAAHVRMALTARIQMLPDQLRRPLTWDRGKEMAENVQFTIDTGVQVYFCDPPARGSEAATRTPTVSCVSTSPKGPTCPCIQPAGLKLIE